MLSILCFTKFSALGMVSGQWEKNEKAKALESSKRFNCRPHTLHLPTSVTKGKLFSFNILVYIMEIVRIKITCETQPRGLTQSGPLILVLILPSHTVDQSLLRACADCKAQCGYQRGEDMILVKLKI